MVPPLPSREPAIDGGAAAQVNRGRPRSGRRSRVNRGHSFPEVLFYGGLSTRLEVPLGVAR